MSSSPGLRRFLLPFTPLYRIGLALRERRLQSGRELIRRLRFPVISIGNLSTGGAGKTPLTIALAQALTQRGFVVDVLSRGYGRSGHLASAVDPDGTTDDFGDEPLLIARQAGVPVYVAPQRYNAGLIAERAQTSAGFVTGHDFRRADKPTQDDRGFSPCSRPQSTHESPSAHSPVQTPGFIPGNSATESIGASAPEAGFSPHPPPPLVHILDDGFQHRRLHRDIDILLLNRADWHDRLLPAGNLREPLQAAMRSTVIAIPATDPELESDLRLWGWKGPIWRLNRRMEIPPINAPILAFCGIARPDQFFAGLKQSTLDVAATRAFPDHHCYTTRDLDRLASQARAAGATTFLTTEKDEVRFRGLHSPLPLATVRLRTEIENQQAAIDWIMDQRGFSPAP